MVLVGRRWPLVVLFLVACGCAFWWCVVLVVAPFGGVCAPFGGVCAPFGGVCAPGVCAPLVGVRLLVVFCAGGGAFSFCVVPPLSFACAKGNKKGKAQGQARSVNSVYVDIF